ncbi:indolepyruvate ferredoxin oxidoreductase subunit alpha [Clostridium sp. CX1]|uniref:indolepyruvate ferredoxin oxidoreductase subunit alpha n=1 Tax=Clostridium sp. CX1 TaxID=2978346 RepID=UPI0021C1EB30|nr:indolepyruvate ferredoxin oxidoreductase subunit alpha [Clostridium sp. CX1]MCT8977551.1 indolepyruvate ferredoxin oxidoreductase subunit alpha [Clostridium sp. CX1]
MNEKAVLTGNEAVSRGFWEAGGTIASSYPGSPTVQILESLGNYKEIFSEWAVNEKVAFEIAMGGSFAGARSMVSMKHVGINIASDPFMTFTEVKTKGGFLLVVGDDPGLTSSQNEQDSRFWGKYANIPVIEPSNPQEVKEYVKEGLKISEDFNTPVLIKLTSRLCHCRGIVELNERQEREIEGFVEDQSRYCMLPPFANKQQYFMKERMEKLQAFNDSTTLNKLEEAENSQVLIITSGMPYECLKEIEPKVSVLKLAMVWPMPIDKIKELSKNYKRVIVIEELMPFMEETLKSNGVKAEGKEYFSFTGELTVDSIREGLEKAGVLSNSGKDILPQEEGNIPPRTPMLCSGCPHRPIFHILKMAKATVMGDIGCYSLGILEPFEVHKTNISMGASLGNALGVAAAQSKAGKIKPIVATIGDGTFFHSGMTGILQLAKTKENITVIVMDNRTTAMTGGQETLTTGDYFKERDIYSVSIPEVLKTFGIKDITVVDQFKYKETKEAIHAAMKREGLSIIVTTRPCALNFKIKQPHFYVDENICISCRSCIRTNCPPISMKLYPGKDKKNSYINPDMCVGCSVCSQVCPVGAIKRSSDENN